MANRIGTWLSVAALVVAALWLTQEARSSRAVLDDIHLRIQLTPFGDSREVRIPAGVQIMEEQPDELEAKWTDWQGVERVVRTRKKADETTTEFEDRHHATTERQLARYPKTQPVGGAVGGH